MNSSAIIDALSPVLVARNLKIIDVKITKYDDVTVIIDTVGEGAVSLDDCVAVNRKFTEIFDQDVEDYSLTVTSPGIGEEDLTEEEKQ